jgi:hypothetical protein
MLLYLALPIHLVTADKHRSIQEIVITSLSTKKRNNDDRRAISKNQVKLNVFENALISLKYEEKAQKLAL